MNDKQLMSLASSEHRKNLADQKADEERFRKTQAENREFHNWLKQVVGERRRVLERLNYKFSRSYQQKRSLHNMAILTILHSNYYERQNRKQDPEGIFAKMMGGVSAKDFQHYNPEASQLAQKEQDKISRYYNFKSYNNKEARAFAFVDLVDSSLRAERYNQNLRNYVMKHPQVQFRITTYPNGRKLPFVHQRGVNPLLEHYGRKGYGYRGAKLHVLHDAYALHKRNPKSHQYRQDFVNCCHDFNINPHKFKDHFLTKKKYQAERQRYLHEATQAKYPNHYRLISAVSTIYQLKWGDSVKQSVIDIQNRIKKLEHTSQQTSADKRDIQRYRSSLDRFVTNRAAQRQKANVAKKKNKRKAKRNSKHHVNHANHQRHYSRNSKRGPSHHQSHSHQNEGPEP